MILLFTLLWCEWVTLLHFLSPGMCVGSHPNTFCLLGCVWDQTLTLSVCPLWCVWGHILTLSVSWDVSGVLFVVFLLSRNYLCGPGWPWIWDPPALSSTEQGLLTCTNHIYPLFLIYIGMWVISDSYRQGQLLEIVEQRNLQGWGPWYHHATCQPQAAYAFLFMEETNFY